ncbi:MAG: glycosyltransferase family 4 protein [Candidatus Aminicenantes bacterium]|nr:glycosyltransferase family 4 protein [Candidatus Aminicenantes bacterium]
MAAREKTILVLGSTIAKIFWVNQAENLGPHGYQTVFYVRERAFYDTEPHYAVTVPYPKNALANIWKFLSLLKTLRPHHIEAFHDLYRWDFLILFYFYVLAARLFRIPVVSVCMGGEILYWERHSFLKKWSLKRLLRGSRLVILKEPYQKEYIKKYRIFHADRIPTFELPNAVDISGNISFERSEDIVLFLNSFKPWRNPEMVTSVFRLVIKKIPQARLIMAGYRTEEEYDLVRREIDDEWEQKVELIPYRLDNRKLYSRAKVFILPADFIYLNNSLLEAMERGIPPVIGSKDPYGSLIIQDGVNGFRVDINPGEMADKVIRLLEDENLRRKMGREARETVMKHFNNRERIQKLCELYRNLDS